MVTLLRQVEMDMVSREDLIKSINEAAQHFGAAVLTFLGFCVYVGVAVSSTTHEVLLLGTNIRLPLFDVAIPLEQFYVLAPGFLVLLHVHLSIVQYILTTKIGDYRRYAISPIEQLDRPFASLYSLALLGGRHAPGFHRVLISFRVVVTTLLPLLLLLATLVAFSPYHSIVITRCQQVLVEVDLLVCLSFFPRRRYSKVSMAIALVAVGAIGIWMLGALLPSDLALPAYSLAGPSATSRNGDPVQRASLSGRDLRKAKLVGIALTNADLRGAILSDANLRGADLRAVRLSPREQLDNGNDDLIPGVSSVRMADEIRERLQRLGLSTNLQGADLGGAQLQGADLTAADLRGAILEGAHLEGANLYLADLSGSHLKGAFLNGATLEFARLNLADLRKSEMWAANLSAASMIGVDMSDAALVAADFRWADLRAGKLAEVQAEAADFKGAKTLGADFQNATLCSAAGLVVEGVNLRGAHLGAIDFSNGGILRVSDLRRIDFRDSEEWDAKRKGLQTRVAPGDLLDRALRRIDNRSKSLMLMSKDVVEGRYLLYNKGEVGDWPSPSVSERLFQEELAQLLVATACPDSTDDFPAALVKDVLGELAPRRPLLSKAVARQIAAWWKDQRSMEEKCGGLWKVLKDHREIQREIEDTANGDPLRISEEPAVYSAR
jgi:uncharacterized protein YjbI with pentapeptide repeats